MEYTTLSRLVSSLAGVCLQDKDFGEVGCLQDWVAGQQVLELVEVLLSVWSPIVLVSPVKEAASSAKFRQKR